MSGYEIFKLIQYTAAVHLNGKKEAAARHPKNCIRRKNAFLAK